MRSSSPSSRRPPGGRGPPLILSEQDKADIVAYMKLLR